MMSDALPPFEDIVPQDLDEQSLRRDVESMTSLLSSGHIVAGLTLFDARRRAFETWKTQQQAACPGTGDDGLLAPSLADVRRLASFWSRETLAIKNLVLRDYHDAAVGHLGAHIVRMWQADVACNSAIPERLEQDEARQIRNCLSLVGSNLANFKTQNQPDASGDADDGGHNESPSEKGAIADNQFEPSGLCSSDTINSGFSQLIETRVALALSLNFSSYKSYAYESLGRFDYGEAELQHFRNGIRSHVVPLLDAYMRRLQLESGCDTMDDFNHFVTVSNSAIQTAGGAHLLFDRILGILSEFDEQGDLANFFRRLADHQYISLENVSGQPPSALVLPEPTKNGAPFLRLQCGGGVEDIVAVTSGLGRVYQYAQGASLPLYDNFLPSPEALDIVPKALGLVVMDYSERLVRDGSASSYRRQRILGMLHNFIYAACIDDFEHALYKNPGWSSSQRSSEWRNLEKSYFPWKLVDDDREEDDSLMPYFEALVLKPFSTINSALSDCCALQIWLSGRIDMSYASELLKEVCSLGGLYPYRTLLEKAGLISPFGPDVLPEIMQEVEQLLWA